MNTRKLIKTGEAAAERREKTRLRVQRCRERKMEQPGYDHSAVKRETQIRVANIRSRLEKCPMANKCKNPSCELHPDRDYKRKMKEINGTVDEGKVDGRKTAGIRKRKRCAAKRGEITTKLMVRVRGLVNTTRRLKRKLNMSEEKDLEESAEVESEVESEEEDKRTPISRILRVLSPKTRKNTLRMIDGSPVMKKSLSKEGYRVRLRESEIEEENGVAKAVKEFMLSDEVSQQCPDKGKEHLRYRKDHLNLLHEKFVNSEGGKDIGYTTFTRYVPENVKKPRCEDWGTNLCKTCLNPQLKVEGLQRYLKKFSKEVVNLEELKKLSEDEWNGFFERLINSKVGMVSYLEWHRKEKEVIKKRKKKEDPRKKEEDPGKAEQGVAAARSYYSAKVMMKKPVNDFMKVLKNEVKELQEHEERQISQFRRIKEVRKLANDPDNKALVIRMDWSENLTLFQVRQEKSAYYHDLQVSINTLMIYGSSGYKQSAATISDVKSHKSAAIWASLIKILDNLNLNDFNRLYIVTDSPTSQYRNVGTMFLAKMYAKENDKEVFWIFTESGHGKGPMDGIGSAIKTTAEQSAAFQPDAVISNAADVLKIIPDSSKIFVSTYNQSDVDKFNTKIPKGLEINWKSFGISKAHEVKIFPFMTGIIEWKKLSADDEYTTVNFTMRNTKMMNMKENDNINNNEKSENYANEDSDSDETNDHDDGDSSSACSDIADTTIIDKCKKVQKTLDDDKKGSYYCAYYDDSHYWGLVINVFSYDVDSDVSKVDMKFLRYKENGYYVFPQKEDREIIDAKYIIYGPCKSICEGKALYKFEEDDEARACYKTLKQINQSAEAEADFHTN